MSTFATTSRSHRIRYENVGCPIVDARRLTTPSWNPGVGWIVLAVLGALSMVDLSLWEFFTGAANIEVAVAITIVLCAFVLIVLRVCSVKSVAVAFLGFVFDFAALLPGLSHKGIDVHQPVPESARLVMSLWYVSATALVLWLFVGAKLSNWRNVALYALWPLQTWLMVCCGFVDSCNLLHECL